MTAGKGWTPWPCRLLELAARLYTDKVRPCRAKDAQPSVRLPHILGAPNAAASLQSLREQSMHTPAGMASNQGKDRNGASTHFRLRGCSGVSCLQHACKPTSVDPVVIGLVSRHAHHHEEVRALAGSGQDTFALRSPVDRAVIVLVLGELVHRLGLEPDDWCRLEKHLTVM